MLAISTRALFLSLPLPRFAEWHDPPRRGSLPKTPQNLDENARVPSRATKGRSRRLCGQPYGSLGEGWNPEATPTFTSDEPGWCAVRWHGVLDGADANKE